MKKTAQQKKENKFAEKEISCVFTERIFSTLEYAHTQCTYGVRAMRAEHIHEFMLYAIHTVTDSSNLIECKYSQWKFGTILQLLLTVCMCASGCSNQCVRMHFSGLNECTQMLRSTNSSKNVIPHFFSSYIKW